MAEHALLSASSANRWLVCTPSAVLAWKEPEATSIYAEEGTKAHAAAEQVLCRVHSPKDIDSAMSESLGYEIAPYINYVLSRYAELTKENPYAASLLIEQKVDYSDYAPGGFGTSDTIIVAGDLIEIVDLKYGKGVPVSAYENPQMRLYALGALKMLDELYNFKTVRMTIVQPRLDNISTDELTVEELKQWGEEVVKPQAEQAVKGEGLFVPGPHCRFCPMSGKCRAQSLQTQHLAPVSIRQQAAELTPSEVAQILPQIDQVEQFIKAVKDYAAAELLQGHEIPGYKLVEGRSVRQYKDDLKVSETLRKAGYAEALIYDRKLIGITAMEKLLGKKEFNDLLGDLVEKPAGKPTLAPCSDKRDIYKPVTALEDYADLYNSNDTENK